MINPDQQESQEHQRGSGPHNKEIMKAILLTAGPINTLQAFSKIAQPALRCITKTPYLKAAARLEELELVQLIKTKSGSNVIIKKSPDEIGSLLVKHGLCSVKDYKWRYQLAISKSIARTVVTYLTQLGIIQKTW